MSSPPVGDGVPQDGELMVIGSALTAEMGYPEQVINLSTGENPMTVACALKDGGRLYIAADSAVIGLAVKAASDKKVEFVESPPLAWVTSGDEAIGDMFGEWLRQQFEASRPEFDGWTDAIRLSVLRLAELNGTRVLASQQNRIRLEPELHLCQVLLAGYIAGIPEIVHLEVGGDWTMHVAAGRTFAAAGGGAHHAAMAYEVLKEKGLLPTDGADAIREVAGLAAKHAPNCEPPVHIRCVTSERVEEVDG